MECRVKICGLARAEDARVAAGAGADFLGFVFAPGSPRRVDPRELERWIEDVRGACEVVGVFRDQGFDEVLEFVERFDLDFVQLHGHESGADWKKLPVRMIEARVVVEGVLPPPRFAGAAWAHLLDGGAGSGTTFEWNLAQPVARAERLFLAGGLHPGNVGAAIAAVQPFAVDVASGVEIAPGVKDAELVRAFVRRAREAVLPANRPLETDR